MYEVDDSVQFDFFSSLRVINTSPRLLLLKL